MLDYLGREFESYCLSYQFFSLSKRKNLDFHEHFLLEILSKCEIKAEKSPTLCIQLSRERLSEKCALDNPER